MASNLNIVKYFLNDANRSQKSRLAHIVAPNFVFTAPLMHPRDFNSYVSFTGSYSNNRKVIIEDISSKDDINFNVKYTIEFLATRFCGYKKRSGSLSLKFHNGLIEHLNFSNVFTDLSAKYRA